MKIRPQVLTQLREQRHLLVWTVLTGVSLLAVLASASYGTDIAMSIFTRDPMAVAEQPFYTGFLSNVGVLLWSSTAAIAIFSAWLPEARKRNRGMASFLFAAGLFTVILLLDDLFMFHERLFAVHLQIGEGYVFLTYGISLLVILATYRALILHTGFLVLLLSGVCLSGSLMIDRVPAGVIPWHHLFEDGMKFLGIIAWSVYFTHTSLKHVVGPPRDN